MAEPAAPGPLGDGALAARVPFAGVAGGEAVGGVLAVAVNRDLAAALAENMLGAAPGPAELRDAVGEFANVVCGHVLSAAGGPAAVFRLGAPEHGAPEHGDVPAGAWHAWLDVEGGRARVTLDAPAALFAAGRAAPAGAAA